MGIENLLSRLHHVKPGHGNRWNARCPAHQDKSPSLTIRAMDDGRILLHCFAGCAAVDVLGALGMSFGDLFPEPLTLDRLPKVFAPFSALDALKCLASESFIIALASLDVAQGKSISLTDAQRAAKASGRISEALEVVYASR